MTSNYTPDEMMTIVAARQLKDQMICFVGIGLPSAAANLARNMHAPDCMLIYESGTIGAKPRVLPLSIGDDELAETADTVVPLTEIFQYWLQGGRVDVGYLGGAQIDKYGNLNTTVIGEYNQPQIRLPGAGGAPEIASLAKEVFIVMSQSKRSFVKQMDFITSIGHFIGNDSRKSLGMSGGGPSVVITDLGILRPDPETKELVMMELYPGTTEQQVQESTGWDIRFSPQIIQTMPPTEEELTTIRLLKSRKKP